MTLRDVFGELAGGGDADPAAALAERGYGELPEPLLSEAIVSFADTAPVEVAEHLSPFVMVHSAVPFDPGGEAPAGDGLALLATAPDPIAAEDPAVTEELVGERPGGEDPAGHGDLDFGSGDGFGSGGGADLLDEWDAAAIDIDRPVTDGDDLDAVDEPEPVAGSWLADPAVDVAGHDDEPDDGVGAAG